MTATIFVEVKDLSLESLNSIKQPDHSTDVVALAKDRAILLQMGCIGTKWGVIAEEVRKVCWRMDKPRGHSVHVDTDLQGNIKHTHGNLFGVGSYQLDTTEKTIQGLRERLPQFYKNGVWTDKGSRKFLSEWVL